MAQERVVHEYVSTGCGHGLPELCKLHCKYCLTPCQCPCHQGERYLCSAVYGDLSEKSDNGTTVA